MPRRYIDTDTGKVVYEDEIPRTTLLYARSKNGKEFRYQPSNLYPVGKDERL
jgi:hypothetical protein